MSGFISSHCSAFYGDFISDKIHLVNAVLLSLSLFLLSNSMLSRLRTLPLASFDAVGVWSEAVVRDLTYLIV